MDEITAKERLTFSATMYLRAIDQIVDAVFKDLGESPEAIRGALVVAESARAMTDKLLGPDLEGAARDLDAEMQATGIVLASLLYHVQMKAMKLMP